MSRQSSSSISSLGKVRPSSSRTSSQCTAQDPYRRRSLHILTQPPVIPIPPSLLKSPYLNSPLSIFRRPTSAPRIPSDEDERWLQDTVPLSVGGGANLGKVVSSLQQQRAAPLQPEDSKSVRGRSTLSNIPPSPPLVRWRPSSKRADASSGSTPEIKQVTQSYFPHS